MMTKKSATVINEQKCDTSAHWCNVKLEAFIQAFLLHETMILLQL